MLSSLKPPTDNLYKFIAIAGLVCIAFGVVLIVQRTQVMLDVAFAGEDAMHEAWLVLGEGFKDGDDETAFEMLNEAWKKAAQGEDPFGLTQEARKLGTLSDEQLVAVRRYEIAVETLGDQHQLLESASWWIGWLIGFGIVGMIVGFGLWWGKTQRHQDKLLQMQTEEQTNRLGGSGTERKQPIGVRGVAAQGSKKIWPGRRG